MRWAKRSTKPFLGLRPHGFIVVPCLAQRNDIRHILFPSAASGSPSLEVVRRARLGGSFLSLIEGQCFRRTEEKRDKEGKSQEERREGVV